MARFTDPTHPDFWRPGEEGEGGLSGEVAGASAEAVAYWVYEGRTGDKKARIHLATCPYCKGGQGARPGAGGKGGAWHGPFATFQAARDAAQATGRDVSTCKHCRPQSLAV
jgi:hypothetical protein